MERIKSVGNAAILLELAKKVGNASATEAQSESMNLMPMTRIGNQNEVLQSDEEEKAGNSGEANKLLDRVMVIRSDDDLMEMDEEAGRVEVMNGACNDRDITFWKLNCQSTLKQLVVGDECLQYVKELKLEGFEELEKVEIGEKCFCLGSECVFEVRECENVESVRIGDGSFVDVVSVVFEGELKWNGMMSRFESVEVDCAGEGCLQRR